MEPLESKLARLPPALRKEAEDFVDFLLSRYVGEPVLREAPAPVPPVMNTVPPPLRAADPPVPATPRIMPAAAETPAARPEPETAPGSPPSSGTEEAVHEIGAAGSDLVTRDYLDYGQFEARPAPPPSPATEAVKRVKQKLAGKRSEEPGKHVLDWID